MACISTCKVLNFKNVLNIWYLFRERISLNSRIKLEKKSSSSKSLREESLEFYLMYMFSHMFVTQFFQKQI